MVKEKGAVSMEEEKRFLSVADVTEIMECSKSQAYKIIRQLNDELKEKGFVTLSGKVSAVYFYERTYQGAAG